MKMSAKQRLWLDAYLNHWNKTQAAKDAGYKCKSNVNFCSVGRANFKKLKPIILKLNADMSTWPPGSKAYTHRPR